MLIYFKLSLFFISLVVFSSCGQMFKSEEKTTDQMPRKDPFVTGNRYKDFKLSTPLQNTAYTGIIRFDVPVKVNKPESFLNVQSATLFSPRSSKSGSNSNATKAQIIIPIKNTSNRGYCRILAYKVNSSYRKSQSSNILSVQGSFGFHFSYSNSCLGAGETGYILAEIAVGEGDTSGLELSIESFSYSKEIFYQPNAMIVPTEITTPATAGQEVVKMDIALSYQLDAGAVERELFILSDYKFYQKNISIDEKVVSYPTPIALFFDDSNRPVFYIAFFEDKRSHIMLETAGESKTLSMSSQSKIPLRLNTAPLNRVRVYSAFSFGDSTKVIEKGKEEPESGEN